METVRSVETQSSGMSVWRGDARQEGCVAWPRGAAKSVKVVVWATQRPRWRRLAGCNGEVEAAVRVESPSDEPKT